MNNSTSNPLAQRETVVLAQLGNFFTDVWNKTIAFFSSYRLKEILFITKTVSLIISLILAFLIIVLLIKIKFFSKVRNTLSRTKKTNFINTKKIAKKWSKIEGKIISGVEANYKLAVIEADKIFNDVLKELGYGVQIRITNMEEIKKAGKIKNNIVEDSKFGITENEARAAVAAYKKGLEDLDAIWLANS